MAIISINIKHMGIFTETYSQLYFYDIIYVCHRIGDNMYIVKVVSVFIFFLLVHDVTKSTKTFSLEFEPLIASKYH